MLGISSNINPLIAIADLKHKSIIVSQPKKVLHKTAKGNQIRESKTEESNQLANFLV